MYWKSLRSIGLPISAVAITLSAAVAVVGLNDATQTTTPLWVLLTGATLSATSVFAGSRALRPTQSSENRQTSKLREQRSDDEFLTESEFDNEVRSLLAEIDNSVCGKRSASLSRTNFIANMSHELRTPLNSIIGFAEVLREPVFGQLTEDQASYVDDILQSGRHLLSLINDVLDLSKIESGKMELEAEQVDLPAIVSGSLRMFREQALKHSITLSEQSDSRVRFIEADARKLKQILFNLLSNAIKFTPEGGEVSVTTERVGESARITVRDTGCGIAPEFQERVFESFFQIETPMSKELAGTGLGLPLVRQIAELHSGRAWCESQVGEGSCFIVELPCEQSDSRAVRLDGSQQLTGANLSRRMSKQTEDATA